MQLAFRLTITILLLSSIGLLSAVASGAGGTAHIDQPGSSAVLSGLVEVRGTALLTNPTPADFRYYRLEYSRVDEGSRSFILTAEQVRDTQVRSGLLDTWDTTLVPNGMYIVRLQVYGRTGVAKETTVTVVISNNLPALRPYGQQSASLGIGP